MTAQDPAGYAPAGPLEHAPGGPATSAPVREEALLAALAGVPLDRYDLRIIRWAASLDDPTVRVIVSLIWRVRAAPR